MSTLIDGKTLAAKLRGELKEKVAEFKRTKGEIGLAVVLGGGDPASQVYVRNKIKACEEVGIRSYSYHLPAETSQSDVEALIDELVVSEKIDGILVQLPLPKHLDERKILRRIPHTKDVDGFCAENVGNLVCPAEFDLGEAHKVVVISVTEGADKPLKYPDMFAAADLMLINKVDLAPYVNFDMDKCEEYAKRVNPAIRSLRVSATTGEGLDKWWAWLKANLMIAQL